MEERKDICEGYERDSVQQLDKLAKDKNERFPIYPLTYIQAVYDARTKERLDSILWKCNNVYLPWMGSAGDTRIQLPFWMRRKGIIITYKNLEEETITEKLTYDLCIADDFFRLDSSWTRITDALPVGGNITIGSNGNWFQDGVDTGFKAQGPKGDNGLTPMLRTVNNKLRYSYDGEVWYEISEYIAAWFRYQDNKIQISRDQKTWSDLSKPFTQDLYIKGYVATSSALPSTGVKQGDIYMVGPTYAAEDSEHKNPIYRMYVYNDSGWVDNGVFQSIAAGVVQTIGNSETEVMSQKAVSSIVGLDTYPVFSDTKPYVKGDIVNYGGLLYEFTADHEAGAWIGTDARETSLRGEVTKLAESAADLGMLNCDNILKRDEFTHATVISNGVTFQYLGQGRYHVYGTATEDVSNSIYLDRSKLPDSIVPGKTYQLIYSAKNALFIVWIYAGGEFKTGGMVNENYTFTPPKDADGLILAIRVLSGTTVDEVVHPVLIDTYTSDQVKGKLDNINNMGTVSGVGNPLVLEGTSTLPFEDLSISGLSADTLVTFCGKNIFMITSDMVKRTNNGNTYTFTANTIRVVSEGSTGNSVSSGENFPEKYWNLNGKTWNHNFKFKFANDTWVTVSGNCSVPQTYDFKAQLQVGDGVNSNLLVDENGLTFEAKAGVEYGIRLFVAEGFVGDVTFYPQIEIGTHKTAYEPINGGRYITSDYTDIAETFKKRGSKLGRTTMYTDNNAVITATANKMDNPEQTSYNGNASYKLNELCADKSAFSKPRKPMISFVDDDTSSIALVERYRNLFVSKGVVGNYAVMTKNLNEQEGLADLLLLYEQEGFGCLYHCYYQRGDETRYWESGNPMYDESLIKENFIRGLRDMERYGFLNYKHWITPYGVNDDFIRNLAKRHGMESLMTMSGATSNNSFISIAGNCDRYNIPRISVSSQSNQDRTKRLIDGCVADNGWVVIVTHANTWGSGTDVDEKVSDIIQYALDSGMEVKAFPEAFETYRASFYFNELF